MRMVLVRTAKIKKKMLNLRTIYDVGNIIRLKWNKVLSLYFNYLATSNNDVFIRATVLQYYADPMSTH